MKTPFLIFSLFALFTSCSHNCGSSDTCGNRSATNSNDQDSDWQITTRVKAALMADNSLSVSSRIVSVETTNGVVTLTGTVSSKEEYNHIERKVKSISGVRKVNNQLTINT